MVFKPEVSDIPIQHAGASLSGISVDDWESHLFERTGHTGDKNLVTPAEVRPDGSIYFQEISNVSGLENINWENMPVNGGIWGKYPPKFDAIEVPIVANIAEARDEHFTAVDEKIGKMLGFFSSGGTDLGPKNGPQKWIDEQEFSMANAEWDKVTDKEDVIAYLRGQSTIRPKSLDTFTRALQAQYLPYEMTRAKYEPSI